ncbi:MAG: type I DNA topoisomerase [Candidatus Krumholzibacteriota bacterium]|nr:type I DNA topoisomerase [Candidatus Krumholzibacteriota bacterium]
MDHVLVIVESPAKARTIKKYLGKGYKVKASVGHIRDLPKKELGIDLENNFKPKYVNDRGKSKIIKELRDVAGKSTEILLATDMDREGEAIAWHLSEILKKTGVPSKRIIFNEITANAIKEAVENPRELDMNKVNAQQARRILDRIVGYLVSPALWKVFYRGLSAGRVQSVGLRLLCEREDLIRRFTPEEYWTIDGVLKTSEDVEFPARLFKVDGANPEIGNGEMAEKILAEIRSERLFVEEFREKEKKRNPQPPFITSTLQREAAGRLGFSAKKTMAVAQQLYEGLNMGDEGSVGLISYMRTDSTRVSTDAFQQGQVFIEENYGKSVVFKGKRGYKKLKGSQDAHEAIRPTDSFKTPEKLAPFLEKDQLALYSLIWMRFLASLAAPAVYSIRETDIRSCDRYLLRANGRKVKSEGFLAIFPDKKREDETWIPDLVKDEELFIKQLGTTQKFTEPPARYSEASLIKELEDKGIGRPSTYASIISIILSRDYAVREGRSLKPTELGEVVWRSLSEIFNDIFEIDFTARMESDLDKVEEAEDRWQNVVRFYYDPLSVDLEKFKGRQAEFKKMFQEETGEICEKCGKKLVKKWSRNGIFLACPGYPECKFAKSTEEEEKIEKKCPKCGGELKYKSGRFGKFIACSNYPDCKYTETATMGIPCPEEGCDGEIAEKKTRRGKIFYGCSKYPDCKYASWDKPTDKKCPECGEAFLVEKSTKKKAGYLVCPECKHEVAP